jgi:heterogeneous nuclear ribonucleoprotein F/H
MLSVLNLALGCVLCKQEEVEDKESLTEPMMAAVQLETNETETNYYIKLSGLPWKSTEDEIGKFLVDCQIVGNVVIINNEAGRPSGDAVVKLLGKVDLERALGCNRKHLHQRFVIVEETDSETYDRHVKKVEKMDVDENSFIRLKGLVWSATEEDVKTFLHDCKVMKVVIAKNEGGKPTGDAFVQLESEVDVEKAKAHNREYLRERFVVVEEIYESQFIKETQEVNEVKQSTNKDYSTSHVKVINLPLAASEFNIQTFLTDVMTKKVTILKNKSGKPSGEAIVEIESNDDLVRCLICHNSTLKGRTIGVDKVEKSKVSEIFENQTVISSTEHDMEQQVESYCYIKLSGLPWKATEDEIVKFLVDCQIVGNVVIINNENGRPSGDAVVKLMNKVDLERALKCNRNYLHNRFVVVEETDSETFDRNSKKGHTMDKKRKIEKTDTEENAVIRLRGLVWSATEEDIKSFLHDCKVKKVVITTNEGGKPTGEAVVHLDTKADVEKAKAHNREYIGARFVIVEKM